ncbi:carboxypeptidase B [Drosophila willistoni]|nr:carboxypeptidase B [Drosophila willistoni]
MITMRGIIQGVLWCTIWCYCMASSQANLYKGYKVYELAASKARSANLDFMLSQLANNRTYYDVYTSGSPAHIMVHPDAQPQFVDLMNEQAVNYKIINNDVGHTLRNHYEKNQKLRNLYPFEGRLGTERYYTHDEITQYIENLAQLYPDRVFIRTVGRTYEGRWLKTIKITNGDRRANKNVILVDGGFHAREWISPAAAVYAIGELVENYETYADLLLDYDWVILPVVNADGYVYTHLNEDTRMWRKTRQPSSESCIGTDPNRNFDFHWNEEGASEDPCAETYAGPKAFSEPEAVVVRDLIKSYAKVGKMYLTLHSYGPYILYPWGWTLDVPDTVEDLHEVAQAGYEAMFNATGVEYEIGPSTEVLYVAAGASDDYAFNAGFPISFTMELPPGGQHLFDPPASDIDGLVKEAWIGILAMARKVVEKYPLA